MHAHSCQQWWWNLQSSIGRPNPRLSSNKQPDASQRDRSWTSNHVIAIFQTLDQARPCDQTKSATCCCSHHIHRTLRAPHCTCSMLAANLAWGADTTVIRKTYWKTLLHTATLHTSMIHSYGMVASHRRSRDDDQGCDPMLLQLPLEHDFGHQRGNLLAHRQQAQHLKFFKKSIEGPRTS